jgi:DNA-binding protein Fis
MVGEILAGAEQGTFQNGFDQIMRRVEHEIFSQAMARADGNQAKAARWLGISRVTLREKLRSHGLKAGPDPGVTADPD